jgi:uncharacterized protein YbjQ (UPF0145 family)
MAEEQRLPLIVTTETVAGYRIVRTLGYVEAGWSQYRPGGFGLFAPSVAVPAQINLAEVARRMGANAVVGLRWSRAHGLRELVYRTAVVIEPVAG